MPFKRRGLGRRYVEVLADLAFLPELELPEQLIFLLLGQRRAASGLLALVDEAREDRPQILQVGRGRHLNIALQPLLGGWEPTPAWKLGRDIDLAPLWMVAGIEQRLEPGEERLDEIYEVAVALGAHLKIGGHEHGADRHRVDRLVRRHETRIIRGGETR